MDTRDLGRISKMIGELIGRLEEWGKVGDQVTNSRRLLKGVG